MKKEHSALQKYVFWFIDIICTMFSYFLASGFRYDFGNPKVVDRMYLFIATFVLLCTVYDYLSNWNSDTFRRGYLKELYAVVQCNFFLFSGYLIILFIIHRLDITSRLATLYFLLLNVSIMYIVRISIKTYVKRFYRTVDSRSKILIIADSNTISTINKKFYTGTTYEIIGKIIVDGKNAKGRVDKEEITTDIYKLTSELVKYSIDDVFIDTNSISNDELISLLDSFQDMGAICHYVINAPNVESKHVNIETFGDFPVVTYRISDPHYVSLLIKRLFDVLGSLIGLLFTILVGIFLVPAIKMESPGPAIFSQIRIGKNGRRFKFYKFRSMYIDAEEKKQELMDQNEATGLMFKIEEDPRITKIGKFIRKTSLDEFPQFWNVLKGDMSLVGTRPPTEDEFEKYTEHYKRRLSMIPGITGLWQVSGRSEITDFDEVVKLDLEYIDNWSLGLDLKILLQTFIVVFKKEGAE